MTEKGSDDILHRSLAAIRRLPNGDVRDLVVGALKSGMRHRLTKNGIMLYGENGLSTNIHFSTSDSQAPKAIVKHLRRLGHEPGRK